MDQVDFHHSTWKLNSNKPQKIPNLIYTALSTNFTAYPLDFLSVFTDSFISAFHRKKRPGQPMSYTFDIILTTNPDTNTIS